MTDEEKQLDEAPAPPAPPLRIVVGDPSAGACAGDACEWPAPSVDIE